MVWTAYGVALGVPAYVAAMYKSFVVFEADDRIRPLKWGLVAWTSMLSITTFSGMTPATATAATLSSPLIYLFSLVLAMVLGLLFVTGHFSQLKFDVTSTWMMAFPIDALAIATLLYYQTVPGVLTQGMAYAGLATAAVATIVLTLHTINAALMNKLWTMDPKYGPLSQQILTHEAFRAASIRLEKQAECLVASGGKNIGEFARQFRCVLITASRPTCARSSERTRRALRTPRLSPTHSRYALRSLVRSFARSPESSEWSTTGTPFTRTRSYLRRSSSTSLARATSANETPCPVRGLSKPSEGRNRTNRRRMSAFLLFAATTVAARNTLDSGDEPHCGHWGYSKACTDHGCSVCQLKWDLVCIDRARLPRRF